MACQHAAPYARDRAICTPVGRKARRCGVSDWVNDNAPALARTTRRRDAPRRRPAGIRLPAACRADRRLAALAWRRAGAAIEAITLRRRHRHAFQRSRTTRFNLSVRRRPTARRSTVTSTSGKRTLMLNHHARGEIRMRARSGHPGPRAARVRRSEQSVRLRGRCSARQHRALLAGMRSACRICCIAQKAPYSPAARHAAGVPIYLTLRAHRPGASWCELVNQLAIHRNSSGMHAIHRSRAQPAMAIRL